MHCWRILENYYYMSFWSRQEINSQKRTKPAQVVSIGCKKKKSAAVIHAYVAAVISLPLQPPAAWISMHEEPLLSFWYLVRE